MQIISSVSIQHKISNKCSFHIEYWSPQALPPLTHKASECWRPSSSPATCILLVWITQPSSHSLDPAHAIPLCPDLLCMTWGSCSDPLIGGFAVRIFGGLFSCWMIHALESLVGGLASLSEHHRWRSFFPPPLGSSQAPILPVSCACVSKVLLIFRCWTADYDLRLNPLQGSYSDTTVV